MVAAAALHVLAAVCALASHGVAAAPAPVELRAPVNATINSMAAASAEGKRYYENHIKLEGTHLCDHYVGIWYGKSHSGFPSAYDHYKATVAQGPSYKLGGWQPGALAFFSDGGNGHVAIGDEKLGKTYSTDWPGPLYVGHASTDEIAHKWGKTFLGWYKPYFH